MTLTRRAVAAAIPAGIGLAALTPWRAARAAPSGDSPPALPANGTSLAFSVWRKGSRIGQHTVSFARQGDGLTVRTAAHFSIGLGPIAFYSYDYRVTEHWQGTTLVSIDAQTNDNGTHGFCTAARQGDALMVKGSKTAPYAAPPGSIAGTHWNRAELVAAMVNPEDGRLMHFTVHDGAPSAPPGGGKAAMHYDLTGFATLALWYDDAAKWVGLQAVAKDGSVVEYHAA